MKLEYRLFTLDFKFEAGTSRGVMTTRKVWFLALSDHSGAFGYGEVAPLPGLSVDDADGIEDKLSDLAKALESIDSPKGENEVFEFCARMCWEFPSLRCGLEMALLDLMRHGVRLWFPSSFTNGDTTLLINGLVWMGDSQTMHQRVDEKLAGGFSCIKVKIGALDFEEELRLIKYIRNSSEKLVIRLDANGGFETNEILSVLDKLSGFDIHSIEQPILPKQPEAMQLLIERSSIPIAFDEELIGLRDRREKQELLDTLKPHHLVLKPSLLGGFYETREWIQLAEDRNMGWWVTSALESNLGLNAISQFVGGYAPGIHQGLGTGQLFHNNLESKLKLEGEHLSYVRLGRDEVPF